MAKTNQRPPAEPGPSPRFSTARLSPIVTVNPKIVINSANYAYYNKILKNYFFLVFLA
jgi:hypothetical protein